MKVSINLINETIVIALYSIYTKMISKRQALINEKLYCIAKIIELFKKCDAKD